ncbi:Dimer_Tnp_hAT domain-containing protein [Cephalotus follicularis]|uniref:Dimer_Tnp_hAT domain-containing protein n=1 Tax=Cephalotus follicularis TaxID=3775 RepID=A0A1Q3BU86_CEPFO|nr:Dimer_Tnp_hAT domain-containing protein [Cephalotus follicularis]
MERYYKKKSRSKQSSNEDKSNNNDSDQITPKKTLEKLNLIDPITNHDVQLRHPSKRVREEFNLEDIISDPGLRPKISHYDVNIRDQIRRTYWLKGPCQPRNHTFPFREFGKESRCFVESWFNLHGTWLEYSIAKDAAFCLCCYIFKPDHGDIINAMHLVRVSKQQLQMLRDGGWEDLLKEVLSFCEKNNIEILNMDEKFVAPGRSQRNVEETTNLHPFRVEVFYSVIDLQIRELNDRFNEVNTELLICMACLDPSNVFSAFDKQKLIRLAKFYPSDFSPVELMVLESQLGTYILDVCSRAELSNVMGIGELAIKLVKLKMDDTYPLVYLLVKLALLLPVATATVERAFSSMKIMKTRLRNRMGDEWMNDSLVAYIERGILKTTDNDIIMNRFQNMKTRRGVL